MGKAVLQLFKLSAFLLLLSVLLFTEGLYAQMTSVRFDLIDIDNGLSQNAISSIVKDQNGFLWIGTKDGLNRYNGYNIKVFRNNYQDPASIPSNQINKLLVDEQNRLWIAADKAGLTHYNRQKDRFENFYPPDEKRNNLTISSNIVQDKEGFLWFAVNEKGLYRFNPKDRSFKLYLDEQEYVKCNYFSIELIENEIWLATRKNGVIFFDRDNLKVTRESKKQPDQMGIENDLRIISKGKKGNVYMGGLNGIFQYLPQQDQFKKLNIPNFDSKDSEIHNLLVDGEVLWFSSQGGGIFKYDPRNKDLKNYQSSSDRRFGLSLSAVSAIYKDESGLLWVGTNGGGLNLMYINLDFKLYTRIPGEAYSLAQKSTREILADSTGNLFVASYQGVRYFNRKEKTSFDLPYAEDKDKKPNSNGLASLSIYALDLEGNHKLWIGHEGSGIQQYNLKTKKFKNYSLFNGREVDVHINNISDLEVDQNNTVWAATFDGVFRKEAQSDIFTEFPLTSKSGLEIRHIQKHPAGGLFLATINGVYLINTKHAVTYVDCIDNKFPGSNSKECLIKSKMTCINILNDSILLVGTSGNGILKMHYSYDGINFDVHSFTPLENELLNTQTIYGILSQNDSIFWFSTNSGLYKYNLYANEIYNFTYKDGLQGNEFNSNSYYKDQNGIMYFGGINGISFFNPEAINTNFENQEVFFNKIQFGDSTIKNIYERDSDSPITIPYNHNPLSIEYFAISLKRPNSLNYFVQLEEVNSAPIFMGKQKKISYFNLSPGEYNFKVWASNYNKIDDSIQYSTLNFTIPPPFYLQSWFKLLVLLLIALFIYLSVRMRTNSLTKQKEKLEREVKLRSEEIKNQKLLNDINSSKLVIKGQNIEQKRISEELHDGIGHLLTSASLQISKIQEIVQKADYDKLKSSLKSLREVLDQSIREVRNISHNLMPNLLMNEGLESAVRELCIRLQQHTDVNIDFQVEDIPSDLNSEASISIYRIVQEIISNSIKHADAKMISIRIWSEKKQLFLNIKDNGKGFDQKNLKHKAGIGLKNIQARTEINNGEFSVSSKKGVGTEIEINIPIKSKLQDV